MLSPNESSLAIAAANKSFSCAHLDGVLPMDLIRRGSSEWGKQVDTLVELPPRLLSVDRLPQLENQRVPPSFLRSHSSP